MNIKLDTNRHGAFSIVQSKTVKATVGSKIKSIRGQEVKVLGDSQKVLRQTD